MTARHLRIDDRLIPGQVTVTWVGNPGANRLIVSNHEAAAEDAKTYRAIAAARFTLQQRMMPNDKKSDLLQEGLSNMKPSNMKPSNKKLSNKKLSNKKL